MVSGGKTTLCDYSMLFSSVIYWEKTARSDFEQKPSRSSGVWTDMATTISVMRLHANGCNYCIPSDTNRTSWYEWYALVSWNTNLPPFLPPLSPTTPITPYNPPNSPLKQINCLRPPRQNGAAWRDNCDNRKRQQNAFAKALSPYNPLSPKLHR